MFAAKAKRIYTNRNTNVKIDPGMSLGSKRTIDTSRRQVIAKVKPQNIPVHDYINFKSMCGNEILLNLDNHENLADTELISGLLELARRDPNGEHNWNSHPITY